MGEEIEPVEARVMGEMAALDGGGDWRAWKPHPVVEALKVKARGQGLWNLFLPDPQPGRGAHHAGVRADRRGDGAQLHRARGLQLQRARHRQHGGALALRLRRAEAALAGAAAGRRDPLGVLHDRAGRRLVRRHQHAGHRRRRRRRGGAERTQVVVERPRRSARPGRHLHGAHARSGRRPPPPAHDGAGAAGRAGRDHRAHAARVRRRTTPLTGTARCASTTCACRWPTSSADPGGASRSRRAASAPAASTTACAASAPPSGRWS